MHSSTMLSTSTNPILSTRPPKRHHQWMVNDKIYRRSVIEVKIYPQSYFRTVLRSDSGNIKITWILHEIMKIIKQDIYNPNITYVFT